MGFREESVIWSWYNVLIYVVQHGGMSPPFGKSKLWRCVWVCNRRELKRNLLFYALDEKNSDVLLRPTSLPSNFMLQSSHQHAISGLFFMVNLKAPVPDSSVPDIAVKNNWKKETLADCSKMEDASVWFRIIIPWTHEIKKQQQGNRLREKMQSYAQLCPSKCNDVSWLEGHKSA